MNPLIITQGSAEWHDYRLGKCTGSRVKDALSFLKNGEPSGARKKYMLELVCERLTGTSSRHYVSPEMEWGTENEPLARAAYEDREGVDVNPVGICQHPTIPDFCASPDGFFGQDGVFEAKCPTTAKHVEWMDADQVPEEHALQCYSELACSGRAYLDFTSHDPRLPEEMSLFVKRLYSEPLIISSLEDGVRTFLAEVDAMVERLRTRYPAKERIEAPPMSDEDFEAALAYLDVP